MSPQAPDYTGVILTLVQLALGALAGFLAATFQLGKYKEKVDNLEKKVADLEQKVDGIQQRLVECATKLDERTQPYASLTKRKSPVSLTDEGESLLQRSGADKFVLENKDELIQKIKDKNPKSAYDVQTYARQVVESLQNDDRFTPFKDFVYKEGIDIEPIFIVMSIYLRDIALPLIGYTPEEIDTSDPTKKNPEAQISTE